jgi:hypothetical protein
VLPALLLSAVVLAAAPPLAPYGEPEVLFRLPAEITESSGVASSSTSDQWVFTHQDSGDDGQFYAVDRRGRLLATYRLGVDARDWEDMARGPDEQGRSSLWLGDIGDNSATRERGLLVHRVPEPAVDPARPGRTVDTPDPVSFRLVYEDGPRDAEALLVHPRTGRLHVLTKDPAGPSRIYAAPPTLDPDAPNALRHVGEVARPGGRGGLQVTAADIAPDASRVALRTYGQLFEWPLEGDDVAAALRGRPTVTPLPRTMQGEGLAYTRDGSGVLLTTEGPDAPVHRLPRTTAAAPENQPPGAQPPGASAGSGAGRTADPNSDPPYLLIGAAGLVSGAAAAGLLTRRRSRARAGR